MPAAPHDLRVEYLRAPIGVGTRSPRFSWFADHLRAACKIEVSTAGKGRVGERRDRDRRRFVYPAPNACWQLDAADMSWPAVGGA